MAEPSATDREPRPTGGYERWTYGAGLAYSGLAIDLNAVRYIPCVARLPPRAIPRDFEARAETRGAPRLLWLGRTETWDRRRDETTSWPCILDLGDPAARRTTVIGSIDRVLADLSEPVRRFLCANNLSGAPAFRLQAPLPTACVDPERRMSIPPAVADPALRARLEQGSGAGLVVMAVIDDGLPFAHGNLFDAAGSGTRVEYCWLQGAAADGSSPFGKQLTRPQIDALIAAHGPDEDAIYARSGALDLVEGRTPATNRLGSHGAHVLDAAAGRRRDAAEDIDGLRIVAVQLPPSVTIDTTGYGKDSYILAAIDYIFACAERIAEAYLGDRHAALPVVVNFSYGYTGGPHDGSDHLEKAIAYRIAQRGLTAPTTLVMPSGNSFGDRMHGEIPAAALAAADGSFVIPWRLQPDDRTTSYLEIWLPIAADGVDPPALALKLQAPTGEECGTTLPLAFDLRPQAPGALMVASNLSLQGLRVGQCSIACYNDRWILALIALAPTEPDNAALPAAPCGRWSVTLAKTGGGELAGPVSCRIQRDNDPYGYARGGRQSYFDDPLDERYTRDGAPSRVENPSAAFVRRLGTLNGIATHDQATVVAGLYADTRRVTEYAGAGRLLAPGRAPGSGDVNFSSISDDSTALRGVLAAGTRSGSAFRLSGTSVAAPRTARFLAFGQPLPASNPPIAASPEELAEWPSRVGRPNEP